MRFYAYLLANKYGLADVRSLFNPDVYWGLTDVERDTLDAHQRNR